MLFVKPMSVLVLTFLAVAGLERLAPLRWAPAAFLRPYLGTDALWFAVGGAGTALSVYVFRPLLSHLAIGPSSRALADWPLAARLTAAVAAYDLVTFLVHLELHRSEWLWSVHKVHHSSRHLDWLATTRTHMMELLARNLTAQAVLYGAGFSSPLVAAATLTYAAFAVVGHSNLGLDLAFLEPVLITPRLHRRHHVAASDHANFGTVFSLWDRVFRSLRAQDTGPTEALGVPGELDTYPQTFLAAVTQPLRDHRATLHRAGPPLAR